MDLDILLALQYLNLILIRFDDIRDRASHPKFHGGSFRALALLRNLSKDREELIEVAHILLFESVAILLCCLILGFGVIFWRL